MSDAAELRAIREEIAALAAKIEPKPRKSHDTRPQLIVRVQPADIALVDAAAEQRGVSRSAFVRDCISAALGTALTPPQPVPAGLRRNNRRKPISDHASQNAMLRQQARQGVIASRMLRAADQPHAAVSDAMMAETACASIVPKLPKAGG